MDAALTEETDTGVHIMKSYLFLFGHKIQSLYCVLITQIHFVALNFFPHFYVATWDHFLSIFFFFSFSLLAINFPYFSLNFKNTPFVSDFQQFLYDVTSCGVFVCACVIILLEIHSFSKICMLIFCQFLKICYLFK